MASCRQIDEVLQAYIDGELSHSGRVISEEHLLECRACRSLLRKQQRCSARLFEAYSEVKLNRDLTGCVLSNLPEMDFPAIDVAGVNRRAKHPSPIQEKLRRVMPVAAATLIIAMAWVIRENWPSPILHEDTLGLVTFSQGEAWRISGDDTTLSTAAVKTPALPGDRYETSAGATLMLDVLGDSTIKLAENTRILIHDSRKISVEKGEVLLNVGKDHRLFKVLTSAGDITVFGTTFDVRVTDDTTTVAVERGEVQVEYREDDSVFCVLKRGQLVDVRRGARSLSPVRAEISSIVQWAEEIVADEEARELFARQVAARHDMTQVAAELVYLMDTNDQPVRSIIFEWEHSASAWDRCGYEVFVYTDRDKPLFKGHLPGRVFNNEDIVSYEMENTGNRRLRLRHIFVKLIPDYSEGNLESELTLKANLEAGL